MGKNYYRDVVHLLEDEVGAYYVRAAKGSHERWNTANGKRLTIPRNLYDRHTANGILKQAGLRKHF